MPTTFCTGRQTAGACENSVSAKLNPQLKEPDMKRNVRVHLTNGNKPIFKCTKIIETSQEYLFKCDDGDRTFLYEDVVSIDDPFILPSGFKINRDRN